jgi:hypothetical protein
VEPKGATVMLPNPSIVIAKYVAAKGADLLTLVPDRVSSAKYVEAYLRVLDKHTKECRERSHERS